MSDPSTSPLDVYPLPFNAALFWALLFVVWSGFNLEFAGFTRLAQPLRGLTITAATAIFAIAVTWALSPGVGHFYPDFAASRDGGTGYFTGALFVLFGFSTYVLVVINWAHWSWPDLGLRQPLVGLCEIAFLLMPTTRHDRIDWLPQITTAATRAAGARDRAAHTATATPPTPQLRLTTKEKPR